MSIVPLIAVALRLPAGRRIATRLSDRGVFRKTFDAALHRDAVARLALRGAQESARRAASAQLAPEQA